MKYFFLWFQLFFPSFTVLILLGEAGGVAWQKKIREKNKNGTMPFIVGIDKLLCAFWQNRYSTYDGGTIKGLNVTKKRTILYWVDVK